MAAAASFVLALTVHALALGLLAGGVALIVMGWGQFFSMVIGAILVASSLFLRPRVAKRDSRAPSLTRDEAPHTFALLDQIAKELGTRNVDVIEFGPDYNAAVYEYGVRRRRCLFIGFALWETLTPQERVAVCSHELGHFANHNPRHGIVIATAFRSLGEWYIACCLTATVWAFLRSPRMASWLCSEAAFWARRLCSND
jgi:Zn-dependent protease with chaperone function